MTLCHIMSSLRIYSLRYLPGRYERSMGATLYLMFDIYGCTDLDISRPFSGLSDGRVSALSVEGIVELEVSPN